MLPRCCRVCLHTDCVFLRRHRTRRLDRGAQCFPGAEGCACTPTASSCAAIASAAWTEERNASQVLMGVSAHRLRRSVFIAPAAWTEERNASQVPKGVSAHRLCLHRNRRLDRGVQCFPGAAGCVCAPTASSSHPPPGPRSAMLPRCCRVCMRTDCVFLAPAAWTEERNASQVLQGVYAHRLCRWPRQPLQ